MSNDVKLSATDKVLLNVAAGKNADGRLVEITPEVMEQISKSLKERFIDIEKRYPELVKTCPYEMRLAVTAWVFKHIVEHARDGGSFRYLIYDRLGFNPDAYLPLYDAGGMTISNEFDLASKK